MIDAAFTNYLPITQCENHTIKYREHAEPEVGKGALGTWRAADGLGL